NGSLSQFGLRFWDYVGDHIDGLAALMRDDSIQVASVRYSDRYLQSPAYILLLASLLEPILVKMKSHDATIFTMRSEEHTSELQSRENLVCRLLLEKKK